jgi:hypothetical protein
VREITRFPGLAPERMRLFDAGELVPGQLSPHPTQLAVEWGGRQIGHPSTYGLLGGVRSSVFAVDLSPVDGAFDNHLSYAGEPAMFGLDESYTNAIRSVGPQTVTVAGHHAHSSSEMVFRWLALFLAEALSRGHWPIEEHDVWAAWDDARRPSPQR